MLEKEAENSSYLIAEFNVRNSGWWYLFDYFAEKWIAESPATAGLENDNFKLRLKIGIFKYISWLNGLFVGVMIGIVWKRYSHDQSNGTKVASKLTIVFTVFTSIVYDCMIQHTSIVQHIISTW